MRACVLLTLGLTACFTDPPSSGEQTTSGSTSSDAGSTSDVDPSTSDDPSTTSTSDSPADGSTTSTSSSTSADASSDSGAACAYAPVDTGVVDADIVILVDAEMEPVLLSGALQNFADNNVNVAVLMPEALAAATANEFSCTDGCDSCVGDTSDVLVPYDSGPFAALTTQDPFSCIFRPPVGGTSGPTRHIWFLTDDPMQSPPNVLVNALLAGAEYHFHLGCPGCDVDFEGVSNGFRILVDGSAGSIHDSEMMTGQVDFLSRLRISCAFDPGGDVSNLSLSTEVWEEVLIAEQVGALEECAAEFDKDELSPLFFPTAGGVQLCPGTCRVMQALPESSVGVQACLE